MRGHGALAALLVVACAAWCTAQTCTPSGGQAKYGDVLSAAAGACTNFTGFAGGEWLALEPSAAASVSVTKLLTSGYLTPEQYYNTGFGYNISVAPSGAALTFARMAGFCDLPSYVLANMATLNVDYVILRYTESAGNGLYTPIDTANTTDSTCFGFDVPSDGVYIFAGALPFDTPPPPSSIPNQKNWAGRYTVKQQCPVSLNCCCPAVGSLTNVTQGGRFIELEIAFNGRRCLVNDTETVSLLLPTDSSVSAPFVYNDRTLSARIDGTTIRITDGLVDANRDSCTAVLSCLDGACLTNGKPSGALTLGVSAAALLLFVAVLCGL